MRLRTWLPPGAVRGLGRRLLVAVALAPGGNHGKARYLLRTGASRLATELSA